MAETYEQHVFGLELQDKFLGPLAKSAKLLEKNAAAWDKFESRVRGGGMDKAIAKVNGLIGRYEKLEAVIKRIGAVKVSVSGGPAGHDAALQSEQRFSAYRIRIDRKHAAEKERLDRQTAAAAVRAEQQRNREEERFSAYRIRLARKEATEKIRESDRALRAELKAAAAGAKAREKASHKYYFGGETSFGGLYRKQGLTPLSLAGGAVGLASAGISAIASVAGTGGEIAFNLGKAAIAAQSMREDSVEAMTALFSSSSKANELFDYARKAAKETKFDTADVVKSITTLATGGFKPEEIKKVYWTVADIESKTAGKGELFTKAINKLKGGGGAAGFGPFQSAAAAGPGLSLALPELGKELGLKKAPTRLEAMKIFRQGKVSSELAINTLLVSTNQLLNSATMKAGDFAKKLGGSTWAGLISNIKVGLSDILNMKLEDNHPLTGFKTLLMAIGGPGGLFDDTQARGRKFAQLMSDFVADIFLPFGGISLKNTGDVMDRIIDAGRELEIRFRAMMVGIKGSFDTFLADKKASVITLGAEVGTQIGKAIVKGAYEGLGELTGLGRYSSVIQGSSGKAWGNLASDAAEKVNVWGGAPAALPEYAGGGTVPGPYGEPRLAIVHSGEEYLGIGAAKRSGGGGSGSSITVEQLIIQCDSPMTLESFRVMLTEAIEEEAEVAA